MPRQLLARLKQDAAWAIYRAEGIAARPQSQETNQNVRRLSSFPLAEKKMMIRTDEDQATGSKTRIKFSVQRNRLLSPRRHVDELMKPELHSIPAAHWAQCSFPPWRGQLE
ncbi:hypothetical protein RRG08_015556 [Elysia crispata]|uniref:Uncharacterized protein n=1 Tax=Elysia crispata TaxID=231223 RepID=A0AAE1D090_9GAST|nr:hypothetical protein RRG08_015556 [Elysia crispata]